MRQRAAIALLALVLASCDNMTSLVPDRCSPDVIPAQCATDPGEIRPPLLDTSQLTVTAADFLVETRVGTAAGSAADLAALSATQAYDNWVKRWARVRAGAPALASCGDGLACVAVTFNRAASGDCINRVIAEIESMLTLWCACRYGVRFTTCG